MRSKGFSFSVPSPQDLRLKIMFSSGKMVSYTLDEKGAPQSSIISATRVQWANLSKDITDCISIPLPIPFPFAAIGHWRKGKSSPLDYTCQTTEFKPFECVCADLESILAFFSRTQLMFISSGIWLVQFLCSQQAFTFEVYRGKAWQS